MIRRRRQAPCSSAISPCRSTRRSAIIRRRCGRTGRRSSSPDRLGYAEAFVGEHVTDRAETITSCLVFIASLIGETRRIKLGSGTVNLPNSHPAAVAAQVAMLDHLLQGRFLFGISPGGLRSDAEVFGNLDSDRTAMFVEAIDMVLKIWSIRPALQSRKASSGRSRPSARSTGRSARA